MAKEREKGKRKEWKEGRKNSLRLVPLSPMWLTYITSKHFFHPEKYQSTPPKFPAPRPWPPPPWAVDGKAEIQESSGPPAWGQVQSRCDPMRTFCWLSSWNHPHGYSWHSLFDKNNTTSLGCLFNKGIYFQSTVTVLLMPGQDLLSVWLESIFSLTEKWPIDLVYVYPWLMILSTSWRKDTSLPCTQHGTSSSSKKMPIHHPIAWFTKG